MQSQAPVLLAGDIGGTKTALAIFTLEAGPRQPQLEKTFPSAAYPDLETIVQTYLAEIDLTIGRAAFGVAGPVVNGSVNATNLPWRMSETSLATALGVPAVHLLNDLAAIATAIPILDATDLHTLNRGEPSATGPIAVVAPGTGLGEAYLVHDGETYHAYPSEGGHANFAPCNQQQDELLAYMRGHFTHISWERVCSGIGIPHIYNFFKTSGRAAEPPWLSEALAATKDITPIIINTALDRSKDAPICTATLETFVSILGAEAGNMALKLLATGGVYLGGGIPPRILDALHSEHFTQAFREKGRFAEMMDRIPIHVILNPKSALFGAAHHGLQELAKSSDHKS